MDDKCTKYLTGTEADALREANNILLARWPVASVILFGSKARGDFDDESDIDILVVTTRRLSRDERHELSDAMCDLGLCTGVFFSTVVVDEDEWRHGKLSVLPLRREIEEQGIAL